MRKRSLLLLTALILPAAYNCAWQNGTKPVLKDFTSRGFISNNCFQVIVKMPPDKKSRSLTDRRESAYIKAKLNINSIVIKNLFDYCIKIEKNNSRNAAKLKTKLKEYLRFGYVFREYYNEYDNVILVYRLYKINLKEEIESLAKKV